MRGVLTQDGCGLHAYARARANACRGAPQTQLQGADVRDASFENALMSGVFFGKDEGQVDAPSNEFAQMEGANLDAIFSRSDVRELCTNPTLDDMQKGLYLGC